MPLTAAQLVKAITEDRRSTSEEEAELRKRAQNEMAIQWKARHDAKLTGNAA
jgi:hypothetical protein